VPARDLVPTGWAPWFDVLPELGLFVGGRTFGEDVIGRHAWLGSAAYGPDGRMMGSATYFYRRFKYAQLFGDVSSRWRIEQRLEAGDTELLRLERKRTASVGAIVPWLTFRRRTLFSASLEIEDRQREDAGDLSPAVPAPVQHPALVGGRVGVRFGNTQAGLRSISAQDGVLVSAAFDYLEAPDDDRWRSGWVVSASGYRSLPSWTTSGRPVLAATARIAEQRGPAASRLTAGGLGANDFEVRGYPESFLAASALWSARTEMRLPVARVSRGLGALPFYLPRFSAAWFIDSAGAASRADRLGSPQLLSTGAELSSDLRFFSFLAIRVRTGVGVPLKAIGPVDRGDARFYITAGTSF
jgi:hypothetical protein